MPNPIETTRKALVDTIRQHAERQGITQGEIASRSGLQRANVNRVLSGRYPPNLDTLIKIVGAIDARIEISCNPAPMTRIPTSSTPKQWSNLKRKRQSAQCRTMAQIKKL